MAAAVCLAAAEYKPVDVFDPGRDGEKDVAEAVAEARRTGRHVIVDVGGTWCSWCRLMDKFFADNRSLVEMRNRRYVWVKVNFTPGTKTQEFLSKYPAAPGYPHLYVLDGSGKLLHSQPTDVLEEGQGYSLARFREFLEKWAPKR